VQPSEQPPTGLDMLMSAAHPGDGPLPDGDSGGNDGTVGVGTDGAGDVATDGGAPVNYELYAVLVHSGTASFGHYYALIKDLEHGEWHEFNDSSVKPIKESELQRAWGSATSGTTSAWSSTATAYMLLYRQTVTPLPAADGAATTPAALRAATGQQTTRLNFSLQPAAASEDASSTRADAAPHDPKRLRLSPPHEPAAAPPEVPSRGLAPLDEYAEDDAYDPMPADVRFHDDAEEEANPDALAHF